MGKASCNLKESASVNQIFLQTCLLHLTLTLWCSAGFKSHTKELQGFNEQTFLRLRPSSWQPCDKSSAAQTGGFEWQAREAWGRLSAVDWQRAVLGSDSEGSRKEGEERKLTGNSCTATRVSKDYTTWQQTTGLKGFHVDWRPRAPRARVLFDISLKMNYYDEETDMNHTANLTSSVRRQGPQSFLSCHQLLTYPQLRNIWEVH